MKGFIVYPAYKNIKGNSHIVMYGRLENGESFAAIKKYSPYFFIKEKDANRLKNKECISTKLKTFEGKKVLKLEFSTQSELREFKDSIAEDFDTYEADIRCQYRFLFDKKIRMSIDIEGEYDSSHENVDRVYIEPEIKEIAYIPKNLKVLSIDIETSSNGKDLYCIGLYSKDYKKVLLKSDKQIVGAVSYKTESDLLDSFREEILSFDPDIITGWNVIDFDFNFIREKFKEHEIPFTLNRDNSVSKLRIEKDFFKASKADFEGRVVLDGIELMKTSFIKVDDYKLNTAAKKVLGKTKLIENTGIDKGEEIDFIYKNNLKKLVDYNLMDCILVYDILYKGTLLDLTIQRSLITGMPLDRVSASIASLDSLYLPKARERGLVCPTSIFKIKEKSITGGYVMSSKSGIYNNTIILDFKSLYPSLIRTFNIDPASFSQKKIKNSIKSPAKVYFKKEMGILPEIIQELWKHRESARKDKNELARWAIKILMNSFFGVLANPNCRFFNPEIANSITLFGQETLKRTKTILEKKKYDVIYQDTDSNFVNSKLEDYEEAVNLGKKLEKEINSNFDNYIKKKYGVKSFLEIEFEKCYLRFLMPKVRSGKTGAKKRYAGLLLKEGKEEIQFVGLEVMRSDWTKVAKEFQKKLFDKIFHKEDPTKFINCYVKDLQNGKFDDKLVYIKSLRKKPEEYIKITPPHVKAARKLKEIKSFKIEYLMTVDGPEPKEELKHRLDYEHYIDKQIKPIANAVLEFYGISFKEVIEGKKQKSLFDF
jgi:DNA polymerase-2